MRNKFFLLVCGWFLSMASFAAELTSIQVEYNNHSRIVFKGTHLDATQVFLLQNPERLVVDFKKTQLKTNLKKISLHKKSHITNVREGFPKKDVLRMVFDLDTPIYFKKIKNSQFFALEIFPKNTSRAKTYPVSVDIAEKFKEDMGLAPTLRHRMQPATATFQRLTIVIDPGHGGKDPGAVGVHGTKEKDVVLAIAKQLAKLINQNSSMRAILTRDGDYYVSLRQRLLLARKNKADLFIAIHADSYFNRHANGASVYSLSEHGASSMAAKWLATRENHSELDGVDLGELEDQSAQLRSVLIDLAKTQTIKDSLRWGASMLGALDDVTRLHYKKVERAPFLVLKSPDIPSILVETGFISNQKEEKRLRDANHQHKIALALYNGIRGLTLTPTSLQ
ncbi:MAG TPA: N-acetylmuramoyl-L-alanine amidase [Gammaproteobacteria bacterium]|jgi:N-acetylmuramoyl-L-alanine amidase|nr:N-acetylmuramoyl-L-alanine amidase [Gammaproteobacteria bacterium]